MNKKSKNVLLLVVLIAIIGIAVGYAALSQNLVLTGTAKVKGASDWKVHFAQGTVVNADAQGVTDPTIVLAADQLTGTFGATLEPGASVSYRVTVVNEGTIGAEYNGFAVEENNANDYVLCEVNPVSTNSVLVNGVPAHEFTVTLTCDDMETLPADAVTETFEVNFEYVQEVGQGN